MIGSLRRRALRPALAVTAVAALFAAAPAAAEPAMWVVHGKHNSTVYLLGTVHVLRPDVVWKSAKIEKALADSKELWLEIADIDNQTAAIPLIQKYGLDAAHPLSSKLSEPDKIKLTEAAKTLNLPPQTLEMMRPWLAALTLSVAPLMKAGYDQKSGVELVLKAAAAKQGDTVNGFETMEQQIRYLADLPEDEQLAFLKETLSDFDQAISKLDGVEKAWEAGDVKKIADELNGEMKVKAPRLYELLLVKRNQGFAKQIEARLRQPGTAFVAVGAAHLAGPDSVQAQLAKDGVKSERF